MLGSSSLNCKISLSSSTVNGALLTNKDKGKRNIILITERF